MQRIFADLIRVYPPDPRHPRAIFSDWPFSLWCELAEGTSEIQNPAQNDGNLFVLIFQV
jgi:hypothetical protein